MSELEEKKRTHALATNAVEVAERDLVLAKAALAEEPTSVERLDHAERAQRERDRAALLLEAHTTSLSTLQKKIDDEQRARASAEFDAIRKTVTLEHVMGRVGPMLAKLVELRNHSAAIVDDIREEFVESRRRRAQAAATRPYATEAELQLPPILTDELALELARELVARAAKDHPTNVAPWVDSAAWIEGARRSPSEADARFHARRGLEQFEINNEGEMT